MKKTEVPYGQSQEAREKKGTEAKVEAPEGKEEAGGQGFKSRREQQDQENELSSLSVAVVCGLWLVTCLHTGHWPLITGH
jgi:hypothetical protein